MMAWISKMHALDVNYTLKSKHLAKNACLHVGRVGAAKDTARAIELRGYATFPSQGKVSDKRKGAPVSERLLK